MIAIIVSIAIRRVKVYPSASHPRRHPLRRLPFHDVSHRIDGLRHRLRPHYDCLYLALARIVEAPLVTADRRFLDAMQTTPMGGWTVCCDAGQVRS